MEYVRGTNLKQLLQGGTPLELPFAAEIVRQVGEALDYAHSKGVVHRDVKPANIIITADNKVKITDFGIARIDTSNLTQEGQLLGTPNYMAPEQILGREVDSRADLFSLGVVLYEMLTRHKPFQGENLTVVSHRIVYDQFTPPRQYARDLPPGVERILGKALAKDPAQRFQRARDMFEELRRLTGDRPPPELESLNETQNLAETSVVGDVPQVAPPADANAGAGGGGAGDAAGGWRRWLGGRGRRGAAAPAGRSAASVAAMPAPPPGESTSASASPVPAPAAAASAEGTGSSGLAEVIPLLPAAAAPAAAAPRAAPRLSRLATLALGAAAVPVLAVAAGILLVAWGQPPASDAKVYHPQVVPLITEGVSLLRAGQAPEAAVKLARAERLAPDEPVLGRLRREAERARSFDAERQLAIEREIADRTAEARAALDRRAWNQAESAAQRILLLDPHHPQAQQMLEQVAAARRQAPSGRRPRAATAAATATEPPPAPQPVMLEERAAEPESAREATLDIDFHSDLPQGTVIVYVRGARLVDEPFSFRKGGVFRSRPSPGGRSWSYTLPAGDVDLRVHVAPAGRPAKVHDLSGNLPAGGHRRLAIHLEASGEIDVRLGL
jgi:hypothetical protein